MTTLSNSPSSLILSTARYNLLQSAERLGLHDTMTMRLTEAKEKVEVTFNPLLRSGKTLHLKAFLVRHRDTLGPAKGGIRMSEDVSAEDIEGLAMEMTWKTALINVPFGGGKSGIRFSPAGLSQGDKETILRAYTRATLRHIGPEIYVPAPDMGTNESDMGHIRDCIAYSAGESITRGCYVTGKPVILQGIVGRKEATGKGVVFAILAALAHLDIEPGGATVAVQGFGNVGSVAAQEAVAAGAKVVAVSDVSGGRYNPKGLDVNALAHIVAKGGTLSDAKEGEAMSNDELLTLECAVLVPAATQGQINAENSTSVRARIVAEGANAPTTPEGDEVLRERNILVIPDILCNAGGVFVSYLEYTQETQREQMAIEEVNERLRRRIDDAFSRVLTFSENRGVSLREAAMDIAVKRVADAIEARGLLP